MQGSLYGMPDDPDVAEPQAEELEELADAPSESYDQHEAGAVNRRIQPHEHSSPYSSCVPDRHHDEPTGTQHGRQMGTLASEVEPH